MPEIVEVEIGRRNLERWTRGRTVAEVACPDPVRFEGDPGPLAGRRIQGWERRGKYLLGRLEGGLSLLSHLGMTGQWIADPEKGRRHVRVTVTLEGKGSPGRVALVDPRRFGWTWILSDDEIETLPRLRRLGPDPLAPGFTAARVRERVGSRATPLKTRLLDQKVICGLGNIAVSEVGHRARIHPHRPTSSLTSAEWKRLHRAIGAHLDHSFAAEEDEEIVYLGYAGATNPFLCYGRAGEACPRCGEAMDKGVLGGRATFWCPRCQPWEDG